MRSATVTGQYEELARASLLEITKPEAIGALVAETTDADGVITMRFASEQAGYPGWQWNVSLAHVDGYDPTVIEAELLPADGALLAPDWVPWSDRLADYKAAQEAAGLEAGEPPMTTTTRTRTPTSTTTTSTTRTTTMTMTTTMMTRMTRPPCSTAATSTASTSTTSTTRPPPRTPRMTRTRSRPRSTTSAPTTPRIGSPQHPDRATL